MEEAPDIGRNIAEAMAAETVERLRLAESVRHPSESGRARESLFAEYLRRLVPDEFGISSGFVVDAHRAVSLQQDLVIYRRGYHPIFTVGDVNFFPIEAVAAVIEVKTRLTSRDVLMAALRNGTSVKRLDRTGGGVNYTLRGRDQAVDVNPEFHEHQVFSAILAIESLATETVLDTMIEFMSNEPRRHWLNTYVAVKDFSTAYMTEASTPRVDPMSATAIGVARAGDENTLPLVDLSQVLISFLRITPVVDFQPSSYLPGSYHVSAQRPLPPGG